MAESPAAEPAQAIAPKQTSNAPEFVLNGYQHDQTTLTGRIAHNFYSTSPLLMFNSDKTINSAAELLKSFKINPEEIRKIHGDSKLWEVQKLVRASTGKSR